MGLRYIDVQVCFPQVRLADGVHQVKLEHGTASGKRVIIVDGKEVSCRHEVLQQFME